MLCINPRTPQFKPVSLTCFPRRPWRSFNREQRLHGNLNLRPYCVPASEFSATFCPVPSPMWSASTHPTSKRFRAAFLALPAARRLRREFLTVRLTRRWPPIRRLVLGLHRASFPAHRRKRIPQHVFLRSPSRRCPMENFMRHTSWSGVLVWTTSWELREASTHNTSALAR